jgi:hypothetical protein
MLHNPKWDITNKPTLEDFVTWLQIQDPHKKYDYMACDGTCAVDQYLVACGIQANSRSSARLWATSTVQLMNNLATPGPRTFGALLKRVEAHLGH